MKKFDDEMACQGRKLLLFMNNVSSHNQYDQESLSSKATELKFFIPSTTSCSQPMDQGVIQACKVKYRHKLFQRVVVDIEARFETKVDLKEAILMLSNAVRMETVCNCFRKAGFEKNQTESDNEVSDNLESSHNGSSLDGQNKRQSIWDFIAREYNFDTTLNDFLEVDNTDASNLTYREIVEVVQNINDDQQPDEDIAERDHQEDEGGFKTIREALRAIRQLRNFVNAKGIKDDGLNTTKERILAKSCEICQTKITRYFKAV